MQTAFHHGIKYTSRIVVKVLSVTIVLFLPLLVLAMEPVKVHNDLFSVNFADDKDGWTCGRWGTILHTSDGGKTWMVQKSGTGYTLSSIHFTDSKNGWAVGDMGTIIHTKNGGETWVKQKSPVPYVLMGVHFATSRKGWIVGERTTILHTEDGGQTWQTQFKDEDFILKSISFCDERNGWAVGEYGYIYRTEDGGKTWQHQAGEFRYLEETGELVAGNFLFNVIAVNPKTAWVVGIDGYTAKTIDGGKTWARVTTGVPKTHLFAVSSDKQGDIFIGGNALLLRSADGGKRFAETKVEPEITYGWLYGITPRREAGFAAVGKGGWIYLSDPTGTTWQRVIY